jgi:hypothetical protein
MLLQVFLPCYFGNEISLASVKLSESLFLKMAASIAKVQISCNNFLGKHKETVKSFDVEWHYYD